MRGFVGFAGLFGLIGWAILQQAGEVDYVASEVFNLVSGIM
jgi:hypothetical protein